MRIAVDETVTIKDFSLDEIPGNEDTEWFARKVEGALNLPIPVDDLNWEYLHGDHNGVTFRVTGSVDEDELNAALAFDRRTV